MQKGVWNLLHFYCPLPWFKKAIVFSCCTKHNFSCKSFFRQAFSRYKVKATQNLESVFASVEKRLCAHICIRSYLSIFRKPIYITQTFIRGLYAFKKVGDFLQRLDFLHYHWIWRRKIVSFTMLRWCNIKNIILS